MVLITVTKNNANTPYLSIADFLRVNYGNYFYLAATTNVTFGVSSADANQITVSKLAIDGKTDSSVVVGPVNADAGSAAVVGLNMEKGYYRIEYTSITTGSYTSSFFSDSFFCPTPLVTTIFTEFLVAAPPTPQSQGT